MDTPDFAYHREWVSLDSTISRFEDFELHMESFELLSQGEPVPLEPQELAVLSFLVEHANELVTKEALLDEVWGHQHVTDAAIATRIKGVRRALNDDGRQQRLIKTVHGKGFRFTGVLLSANPSAHDREIRRVVTNLPRERTPIFGREVLKQRCQTALQTSRLVSLLGIGGAGKTRLAVSAGRDMLETFADGVWFVDLVPCQDEAEIVAAVGHTLGLQDVVSIDALMHSLSSRQTLLILDNCEHVLDPVRAVADALLDGTANVHLLGTSRVPLDLPDEIRLPLGTLAVAQTGDELPPAVALFEACASRIGVVIESRDLVQVSRLCEHLDGLPLALELAAAQLRHLSLDELYARLDQRFSLLSPGRGGKRSSLESVLQETRADLEPSAWLLLQQLAVFPAAFEFDAADSTMCAVLDSVSTDFASLVDTALIMRAEEGGPRWRMLESVRLFVLEQTDAAAQFEFRRRHADWVLGYNKDALTESFWRFKQVLWYGEHVEDTQAAEAFLFAAGEFDAGAELLIRQSLAMAQVLVSHAANRLQRLEAYLDKIADQELLSLLHCAAVYYARAANLPEGMLTHSKMAVATSAESANWEIRVLSRYLMVWPRLASPHTAARLTEIEQLILEPNSSTLDTLKLFRAYLLTFENRWSDVAHLLQPVVDHNSAQDSEPTYSSISATYLWGLANVLDNPLAVIEALDRIEKILEVRELEAHFTYALACASAADAGPVERSCLTMQARQQQANVSYVSQILLPCALLAHRRGELAWARDCLAMAEPSHQWSYLIPAAGAVLQQLDGLQPDDGNLARAQLADQSLATQISPALRDAFVERALEWLNTVVDHTG